MCGKHRWIVFATAAFLISGRAIFAQEYDVALRTAPAYHPVVLWTEYKKDLKAITAVRGDSPQIIVNDKLVTISTDHARFIPAAAVNFAPGFVNLSQMQTQSGQTRMQYMFQHEGNVDGGVIDQHSDFSAVLTPTRDYDDCYVAVLFFNRDFARGESDKLVCEVVFKRLGALKAAEPKRVNFRFGYLGEALSQLQFFPLVFTHGAEVRTNVSLAAASFFRHMDLIRHQKLIDAYVGKHVGMDHNPQVYQQVAPVFPEDVDRSKWPNAVTVSFMVTEDGTVESVEMESSAPKGVAGELRRAIESWLFLPRLQAGRRMRTMIRIPVALSAETSPAK